MRFKKHFLPIYNDENIRDMIPFISDQPCYLIKTSADITVDENLSKKFKPNLNLIDPLFQAEDGNVVCQSLKQLPALNDVPIMLYYADVEKRSLLLAETIH